MVGQSSRRRLAMPPRARNSAGSAVSVARPPLGVSLLLVGLMTCCGVAAYGPDPLPLAFAWARTYGLAAFGSLKNVQLVFIIGNAAHLLEACVALRIALRGGMGSPFGWWLQTLCVGYPSLKLLLARSRKLEKRRS